MNKTIIKTVFVTIAALLALKAAFLLVDHIHTQAANDRHMEQMMQAIAADPDAVTVKDADGRVITDAFISAHLEEFEAGEYKPAIAEIRDNRYSFDVMETNRNAPFLNASP